MIEEYRNYNIEETPDGLYSIEPTNTSPDIEVMDVFHRTVSEAKNQINILHLEAWAANPFGYKRVVT